MAHINGKMLNFASREIKAAQLLIDAIDLWRELRVEWDAQGVGSLITNDMLLSGETTQHVSVADLAAGFTTLAAIEALLAQGHYTNLYKLVS